MQNQRKTLPTAGSSADSDLGFNHSELLDAWVVLYDTLPPMLGEGEKTQTMIAREMGVDLKTAKRCIAEWVSSGKLIEVGERRSKLGRPGLAYRLV
jgi:hypothetical protein